MKYFLAGSGDDPPCASCSGVIDDVQGSRLFKSTFESAFSELARMDKAIVVNACHEVRGQK
jgi:hypothetical protein